MEARGVGFSEMQSFWSLPFHDHATVGDVCVAKYVHPEIELIRSRKIIEKCFRDKHKRQLYDTIHVTTSNPVWLYTMKATSDYLTRYSN